ncbi:MAG: ABC transporter substrate-binding protein [Segniliparus sp.]|uniref:ABC transporter substrate-binding protein n=1 Tax=Segniliparus sp. TaxID=2804064 RepID=UPI003F3FAAEB
MRPADCQNTAALPLRAPGKLTVATDEPAYAPWFEENDPANGRGFESAVAYAVAREMGFAREQVVWTRVPFANVYAPGEKAFDFDLNEVSITPARQQAVDFSDGYYQVAQVVLAIRGILPGSAVPPAPSLAAVAGEKIGVVVGTTSAQAVEQAVKPQEPVVYYDTNELAVQALLTGQVGALAVDLPTGFEIEASTRARLSDAAVRVVGKIPAPSSEQFGLVLNKRSPLTSCVNEALGRLRQKSELAGLERRWLGDGAGVPTLT